MKLCTKCRTEKSLNEFYKQPPSQPSKDGYTYWCKQCYADNYEANKERQKLSNRRASIKRRYGLSVEEYDALIAGGCTACGTTDRRIVMDHCHATNSLRAPLCDGCNVALGGVRDSIPTLQALISYLERHAAA